MKKPTKAQRHQIYKDAILYLTNKNRQSLGICSAIYRALSDDKAKFWDSYEHMSYFPEVLRRKPENITNMTYWWVVPNIKIRIKVLEECIEETTPKTRKK